MTQEQKMFDPPDSMEAEEARAFIAGHEEGTYTILDVRQPREYEKAHIPGARLIPLPELPNDYRQLDPDKPLIVHCASGGRSLAASRLLTSLGFPKVYNLAGGIRAFQGQKAAGAYELNLDLVRGDETPAEIIALAYGMEKAQQQFYETVSAGSPDREVAALCTQLAQAEVRHQQRLEAFDRRAGASRDLAASVPGATLEGGFKVQEFLEKNRPQLEAAPPILELAMMLETQALDLYLRFAHRCSQAATQEVLFAVAAEEKVHLARLGKLLDEKLQAEEPKSRLAILKNWWKSIKN
jgi:sulfur-carrier protein adenylyltransferase/sulfurtransferase